MSDAVGRCPLCRAQVPEASAGSKHRPFCSARCQLLDLGNWLGERYVVPEPLGLDGGPMEVDLDDALGDLRTDFPVSDEVREPARSKGSR